MILLLLLTTFAHAGSAPKLYANPNSSANYQIRVIPAQECERLVEDTLYSKEMIKQGVKALGEIAEAMPPADCLEQTLTHWESELPVPDFIPPPVSDNMAEPSLSKGLNKELTALLQKKGCYEGKKKYCKDGPKLSKAEYDAAVKEIKAKRQEISDNWSVVRGLSAFIFPAPQIDNKLQRELIQKLWGCEQNFAEKAEDLQWKCGKETLSAKEHDALEEKSEAESNKVALAEATYREKKAALDEEFDRVFAQKPDLWAKAKALYQTLQCINPYGKGNALADDFNPGKDCSGQPHDLEKARKQAAALLGNGPKIVAEAQRRQHESAARVALATARLNPARNFNYNLRALLARYQAFLRNGGKPENLKAFCSANEREQLRDFAFHEIGERLGADIITYGLDDRFLEAAQKYGLTEGELSAVYAFTGSFYSHINDAILKKQVTPDLEKYKSLLESALAKLPPYQAGPLKRFVSFPDDVLKQHKVGKVVCYKSFSSTSKNPSWAWSGKQELVIYPGVKGKDVSRISSAESEDEVLFTSNSCFKVLSANGDASKFVLGEVDKSGKVIAKIPEKEQP